MKKKHKVNHVINVRVKDERGNYYQEVALQNDFYRKAVVLPEELAMLLDKPEYIQDKGLALDVCIALIVLCLTSGGMEQNSITHRLALRLYDYINRMGEAGT